MYTDIYKAIVKYIDTDLRNTDYVLNFGVVAIATQSPRASVKFCLKNIQTNKQKRWTLLLMGKTILELEANVRASVAVHLGKFFKDSSQKIYSREIFGIVVLLCV